MEPYRTIALNNAWANATLYEALNGLSRAAFTAKRPGFFSSLAQTMNHLYEVDLYYLDVLEEAGQGMSVYDRARIDDVPELGQLQYAADLRFATFCNAVSPGDIQRRVATIRSDASGVSESIGAVILHLAQHQIHHRGQAHVQLSDAGLAPPQLDDFHLEYRRAPSANLYFS